jgi:hypothetical protein
LLEKQASLKMTDREPVGFGGLVDVIGADKMAGARHVFHDE